MGFFRQLWSDVVETSKSIADDVKKASKQAVKKVIIATEYIDTKIDKAVNNVKMWCGYSKKSDAKAAASFSKVGKPTEGTKRVIEYATLITEYINANKRLYEDLEADLIDVYIENYNNFNMEETPLGRKSKKVIMAYVNDSSNKLSGIMIDHLNKRVSKDDEECMSIFNIESDSSREKEMKRFLSKVKLECIEGFVKEVRTEARALNRNIESFLNGELNSIERRSEKSLNEFNKIKAMDSNDMELKQKELIKNSVIISQCKNMLKRCDNDAF